jgi:hypothetical protein
MIWPLKRTTECHRREDESRSDRGGAEAGEGVEAEVTARFDGPIAGVCRDPIIAATKSF